MDDLNTLLKKGSVEELHEYLKDNVELNLNEALINAIVCSQLDMIKILLDFGADLHHDEEFPLIIAIISKKIDIIKYFIAAGADITEISDNCKIAIVETHTVEMTEYLLDAGLVLDNKLFQLCIEAKRLDLFKLFYQRMPNINLQDLWEKAFNSLNIAKYMLDLPFEPIYSKDVTYLIINVIKANDVRYLKVVISLHFQKTDPSILGGT